MLVLSAEEKRLYRSRNRSTLPSFSDISVVEDIIVEEASGGNEDLEGDEEDTCQSLDCKGKSVWVK